MLVTQSIRRIRAYRAEQGLSTLDLSRKAGLSESTIRNMDSPKWNPEAKTLAKLEAVIPPDWQPPAESSPS